MRQPRRCLAAFPLQSRELLPGAPAFFSTMKQAADAFIHYSFRALPVADEDGIILGVVP
jgi:hypothetical protein